MLKLGQESVLNRPKSTTFAAVLEQTLSIQERILAHERF